MLGSCEGRPPLVRLYQLSSCVMYAEEEKARHINFVIHLSCTVIHQIWTRTVVPNPPRHPSTYPPLVISNNISTLLSTCPSLPSSTDSSTDSLSTPGKICLNISLEA